MSPTAPKSPVWLNLSLLDPHPKNPRVGGLRDNVVAGIAAQLKDAKRFEEHHALIVRKKGDHRYEILQGHHRAKGAEAAGLDSVPCWIVEVTDDEALVLLG